jgi:hypothetical protein
MTIEQLGSLGEFLGSIAVLVTLIYLAIQIRQNTRQARAASRQSLIDTFYDFAWKMGSDEGVANIMFSGLSDFESLSDQEKFRFNNLLARFEGNLYNGLLLHEAGLLDEDTLNEIGDRFASSVARGGGKLWYESTPLSPLVKLYVQERQKKLDIGYPGYFPQSNSEDV